MIQKFTRDEVRAICLSGTQKTAIFYIPIETQGFTITYKVSYWHERGGFVAEPGVMQKTTWSTIAVTAPAAMIEDTKEKFKTWFGVNSVAGITLLGSTSIIDTICKITQIGR